MNIPAAASPFPSTWDQPRESSWPPMHPRPMQPIPPAVNPATRSWRSSARQMPPVPAYSETVPTLAVAPPLATGGGREYRAAARRSQDSGQLCFGCRCIQLRQPKSSRRRPPEERRCNESRSVPKHSRSKRANGEMNRVSHAISESPAAPAWRPAAPVHSFARYVLHPAHRDGRPEDMRRHLPTMPRHQHSLGSDGEL